jgi:hypothetical protein
MVQPFKLREQVKLSDLDARFPEGHVWIFWATPTPAVIQDARAPLELAEDVAIGHQITEEAINAAQERFYRGVAELVLDTGATGLDLNTPAQVQAVFEDETIDRELIAGIVDQYLYRILQRRIENTKKAIGGLQPTAASSTNNGKDSLFLPS